MGDIFNGFVTFRLHRNEGPFIKSKEQKGRPDEIPRGAQWQMKLSSSSCGRREARGMAVHRIPKRREE